MTRGLFTAPLTLVVLQPGTIVVTEMLLQDHSVLLLLKPQKNTSFVLDINYFSVSSQSNVRASVLHLSFLDFPGSEAQGPQLVRSELRLGFLQKPHHP